MIELFTVADLKLVGKMHLDSLIDKKSYTFRRATDFHYDPLTGWIGATTFSDLYFYNIRSGQKLLPTNVGLSVFTSLIPTKHGWLLAAQKYSTQSYGLWRISPGPNAIIKDLEKLYRKTKCSP